MMTYVVVLKNPEKMVVVLRNVKKNLVGSDVYKHSENVFFLSMKDFVYINELAKAIGFSTENKITGFVTKISTIQGLDSPDLWGWIVWGWIEKDD